MYAYLCKIQEDGNQASKELEEKQFKEQKELKEKQFKEQKELEEKQFKEQKELEEKQFKEKKKLEERRFNELGKIVEKIVELYKDDKKNTIDKPTAFIDIAIKTALEQIRINPSDQNTIENLIYFYSYNNNIDKVNFYKKEMIKLLKQKIKLLTQEIREDPFNSQLYYKCGIHYKRINQYEKAITYLKFAIILSPCEDSFHLELAEIYFYEQKNIELAKKQCILIRKLTNWCCGTRDLYNKIISFEKKNNSKTKETQETQDIQETKKREKEPSFSEVMEIPSAKRQKTESESQLDSDKSKTRASGSTEITVTSDTSSLSEKAVAVKLEADS